MNRFAALVRLALLGAAASCSGDRVVNPKDIDRQTADTVAGFTISNVVRSSSVSSGVQAARAASGIAFVSAASHTFEDRVQSIVIRNESKAAGMVQPLLVDGGFDPVAIAGEPGDDISVALLVGTGDTSAVLYTKIPARKPPTVVRTVPSKGRVDVALNTMIEIVFSEPIDKSSVTADALYLMSGQSRINGSLSLSSDGLVARITPTGGLAPSTNYSVMLSSELRDLDGDALIDPSVIDFKTESSAPGSLFVLVETTIDAEGPADPDGYLIQVQSQPGQHVANTGEVRFTVPTGLYTISIAGLSDNCVALDATRSVYVYQNVVSTVLFTVRCGPPPSFNGTLAFVSERDGNPEIYTSKADGTDLKRLTSNSVGDFSPAWSPDGQRIAFVRGESSWDGNIYIMNADGSNVTQLTTAGQYSDPSWSPDGRQIAVAGILTSITIFNVDEPQRNPRSFGFGTSWHTHPVWSPDGQYIMFGSDYATGDSWHLVWRASTNNLDAMPRYIPVGDTHTTVYMFATWSPDGSRFAYAACDWFYLCFGIGFIGVANQDGSGATLLQSIQNIDAMSWSPDGSTIAYSSTGCYDCNPPSIYFMSPYGLGKGLLISNAYSPAWKPLPR